jgi:polyhydroxyalkanoate synthesis regulator phasin
MVNKDSFQKYLDAGVAFTNLTRARAEELVAELVQSGEFQSGDARAKVDELIERSRRGRELLVAQVRHEVARQMESAGITNLEDLAKQVAALLGRTAATGRAATQGKKHPAKKAPAKASKKTATKKATKKATAKKAAAKKSPARKAAAKKAAATKASAKKVAAKAPAKKAASGPGSAG